MRPPSIATAAADAPEKILVFSGIGGQQAPVGGDHIGADDVVDCQSIFAVQMAPAAAQREARDAHGGDNALRGGETEGLRLAVEFSQLEAGLGANGASGRINANAFHGREINH